MNNKLGPDLTVARSIAVLVLFLCLGRIPTRADVSLFLLEATGVSGEASSAGHVSIYLSRICAETPVQLRLCRPGEKGVVIAAYPNLGADKPYEWVAIPLLPFLVGVEEERDIPLYVNGEIRTLMRESYRRKFLQSLIAESAIPTGNWQQMIGNAYNRDIYSFTLRTTPAEDAAFIEQFNQRPNKSRFNTMFRNCADFAREVLNLYFPHAARRDALNDFTMTSPKAVARSLTRYAARQPERLFTITKFAQLAGPIRRSQENRNYSEMAISSKKYVIPQLLFKRELLAIFAASYFLVGRFNIHQAHVAHATPEIAELTLEESRRDEPAGGRPEEDSTSASLDSMVAEPRKDRGEIEKKKAAERRRIFGTDRIWTEYRATFAPMLQKAIEDGLFADVKEVQTFFKDLELQSEPAFDARGALMLRVSAYGEEQFVGLTRDNILRSPSNPQLAYKLLLAKISANLKTAEKNRESLEAFELDWDLLQQLSARSAETRQPLSGRPKRFLTAPEKTTLRQKIRKIFVFLTH